MFANIELEALELVVAVESFDEDSSTSLGLNHVSRLMCLVIWDGQTFPEDYKYMCPLDVDMTLPELVAFYE